MEIFEKKVQWGKHNLSITTGMVGRRALSSVTVTSGDAVVLVTVTAKSIENSTKDFFPLSVYYQERFYAAGKIPGGFLKREGRSSETEILASRIIGRSIRPLFPKNFSTEVN